MTAYMTEKLREFACILRTAYSQGKTVEQCREWKKGHDGDHLPDVVHLPGRPPQDGGSGSAGQGWELYPGNRADPKEFYDKYVGLDLSQYISLINAPTADKPYYHSYTVKFLGNVWEGRQVRYVNLPIEELKKAAIAQMQQGEPVWFGCDVGKSSEREQGLMDLELYHVEELFATPFAMDKAQRLSYGQSLMTHAMVFQGVNLDENGKPNRWRGGKQLGERTRQRRILYDDRRLVQRVHLSGCGK